MGAEILPVLEVLLALQVTQASVGGTVRDEATGALLGGVTVELTDLNRATLTNSDGSYILRDIPAGAQHLRVRTMGHAPRTLHALVPSQGHLEIHVALRPVAFALTTVEVRAPVIMRGSGSDAVGAFPERSSSIAGVRNHPLLSEPDVFQALAGGEVVVKPESPSGVHVRGGSSDQTAFVLDGVPVFSPYHAGSSFSAWNPDALSSIHISSVVTSAADPSALSGSVGGVTRTPGERAAVHGSATTTQTRITLDGPIGATGAGYLVSSRAGFPGIVGSRSESSYLAGRTSDWLAKLEAPVLGGKLRLLGYESENEISTATSAHTDRDSIPDSRRNSFEWHSQSLGAEWKRDTRASTVRLLGWTARADAESRWLAQAGQLGVGANRRDDGFLATVERRALRATSRAGLRAERSTTSYGIDADSSGSSWRLDALTHTVSLFAEETRSLGDRLELKWVASAVTFQGAVYAEPRTQLRWSLSERWSITGGYARHHQFAQSFRNPESVVGNIFPADLFMSSSALGMPAARSDLGLIAAEYRAKAGVRLGAQLYARALDNLLIVAPGEGEPFATQRPVGATGSGSARGLSLDATVGAARFGFLGNYGYQRVRRTLGGVSFTPDHGATHLMDVGFIVLPTLTSSIRLGATGAIGRRTTSVANGFEWEACNLRDGGCEFSGSPSHSGQSPGAARLPLYLRVDLGVRKHWHFDVTSRDLRLETFATVTNLLNRMNVLTYAIDPATNELAGIEMRPRAPLVFGIDWRF